MAIDVVMEAMRAAVSEAEASLREGNHGFGAAIVRGTEIVCAARDREETERDPTSHAEANAIRLAAKSLGKDLSGCALVSTHEPCPMCASAIVWSGIGEVAYGFSIESALAQGRDRIPIGCREIFKRSGRSVAVRGGVMAEECSILYDAAVRKEVKRLRGASDEALRAHDRDSAARRRAWFEESGGPGAFARGDPLEAAYSLLLARLGVAADQLPIVERGASRIVFRSMNPCPTLEACRILGLDTRNVCRAYNEGATDALVKLVDPRLRFARNYGSLRPHSAYCEEMILLE